MMMKRIRLAISFSAAIVFIVLIIFAIKFLSNSIYRKQLPEYPDFKSLSRPVKDQILTLGRRTYNNPSSDNLGKLGMIYYSSAFYEKANQCYHLAIKKNSADWKWNYYLGYLNLDQGESQASITNFKRVIEKDPNNYMALFYIAEAHQSLGIINNAEGIYKKIAVLKSDDFVRSDRTRENDFPLQTYALFRLSRIYLNSNRLESAELTLNELIEKQITFGPAYRLLGNVYTRMGKTSLGKDFTTRANDLSEYIPPPDEMIDKIALIARDDTYLLKQIDDAIRSGNFKWALKLLEHSLKYNPDNKYLISKAIFGYFSMGYDSLALPYLDKHINYYSDNFNELIDLADLLLGKGFNTQAMNYFNQAKKLKPGNSRLAVWLLVRGMKNQAVELLNEMLINDPKNVKILIDAANMMMKLGNKTKAEEYLTTLKGLSPSNPDVKKLAGMIAEREGKQTEALSIYEDVFRNNPKDITLIRYLTNIYLREKMWGKAINHFKLALNSYPNEPILLDGLGSLLISCPDSKLINISEGKEYAERAFINVHGNLSIKLSAGANMALAYAKLGDKQKSSNYINLTSDLAKKGNISQDYLIYFDALRKQYNIPK
jgi:tetratricopeptide (TPR) repeat protein